jgi:hypothetical protein
LIAIVNIGQIHEAETPEMVVVHSAKATVEKIIYYKFGSDTKLPDSIIIYQIEPNGGFTSDDFPTLHSGRRFVMLKQNGDNKFIPYDVLSLQEITKEGIFWPTLDRKREQFSQEEIIAKINKLIKK